MRRRRDLVIWIIFTLSVSLIFVSAAAVLMGKYYGHIYFQALGGICQEIIGQNPEAKQTVLAVLKNGSGGSAEPAMEHILSAYGYEPSDFLPYAGKYGIILALTGFLTGGGMFLTVFFLWRRRVTSRIHTLTDDLERINTGDAKLLLPGSEDAFSGLQDEIYKTVTELHQTRDAAVKAKKHFADNLYNIAHQIKTPITAISLSLQMMQNHSVSKYSEQIRRQLSRLNSLEESLLLLSRIDSGTLPLKCRAVDVYTLLMLACDNLEAVSREAAVEVEIAEAGGMTILADLEWTMEAVINLFKNCIEHTPPGGTVSCSYERNPLYTQILITDTGEGFAREDLPHLFERFYRGRNAKKDGVGIGLSLSRAIIERQNGTIRARNLAGGGACFDVRFYAT